MRSPWSHNCWWKLADHTSTWVYLYGTWPGRRIAMCYRKRNQSTVVIGWNWFVLLKHSNNIPSQKNKTYWRNPANFQTHLLLDRQVQGFLPYLKGMIWQGKIGSPEIQFNALPFFPSKLSYLQGKSPILETKLKFYLTYYLKSPISCHWSPQFVSTNPPKTSVPSTYGPSWSQQHGIGGQARH